jgi:hypothetical protein
MPTRETLADAITAMQNNSRPTPSLDDIDTAMCRVEERIEARLSALGNGITNHMTQATLSIGTEINSHTTKTVEFSTNVQSTQHSHLVAQLRLLTNASEEYTRKMTGISSALLQGPPDLTLNPAHPHTIPEDIIYETYQ